MGQRHDLDNMGDGKMAACMWLVVSDAVRRAKMIAEGVMEPGGDPEKRAAALSNCN